MSTLSAAGVTFRDTDFDGYLACMDCDGLVSDPDSSLPGVDPSDHVCS